MNNVIMLLQMLWPASTALQPKVTGRCMSFHRISDPSGKDFSMQFAGTLVIFGNGTAGLLDPDCNARCF